MMIHKFGMFFVVAATLAACSPKSFETEPVQVQTPSGVVTCQLYLDGFNDWDRSVGRPDAMSVEAADAYCKREGSSSKAS